MAYVVTSYLRPAHGYRATATREEAAGGDECIYYLGSPSGLNKCAASRVPAGAQIVTYVSA